jgi:hypothetical protein
MVMLFGFLRASVATLPTYDASSGGNNHENIIYNYRSLSPSHSNQTHVNVCKLLYHPTTTLAVIMTLLRRPHSEMLAILLVREPPAGVILNDFTVKEVMADPSFKCIPFGGCVPVGNHGVWAILLCIVRVFLHFDLLDL